MKYLLILLIFTLSVSARIGETIEECKKRYGKTTIKTNKHQMKYAQFYKNNFHILCLFDDDKCAYIIYLTKRRNFKKGEEEKALDELEKVNAPDSKIVSYGWCSFTNLWGLKYLEFFDKKLVEIKTRNTFGHSVKVKAVYGLTREEIAFSFINKKFKSKLYKIQQENIETPKSGKTGGL